MLTKNLFTSGRCGTMLQMMAAATKGTLRWWECPPKSGIRIQEAFPRVNICAGSAPTPSRGPAVAVRCRPILPQGPDR